MLLLRAGHAMRTAFLLIVAVLFVIIEATMARRTRGSDTPLWRRDSVQQLAALPLPLPDSLRAGATLVGVDSSKRRVTLRNGANGLVCTIWVPGEDSFDVRCYQQSFMPVIDARWEHSVAGASYAAIKSTIDSAIASGTIVLPDRPTAGYRMLGPARAFNAKTGRVSKEIERWESIHVPYRTAAEMGLPSEEQGGSLFVMSPGTYWAHVMIMHPQR
jgi:hypothetical protein